MQLKCNFSVIIPALKKTAAFQDDLVKKLSGISLIQRSINKAIELGVEHKKIHLLTDSEEISLIAKRNNIQVLWDAKFNQENLNITDSTSLSNYIKKVLSNDKFTFILSPYAPLISNNLLWRAQRDLISSGKLILKPVQRVGGRDNSIDSILFSDKSKAQLFESEAFTIVSSGLISHADSKKNIVLFWEIPHDFVEIKSYQDWWICEKLLTRKRIVFRVIGSNKYGMGHIYRALSLAHDITDHEVLFVCDTENIVAVNKLAGYDYWLGVYDKNDIVDNIIKLKPDMVINDILSTKKDDVLPLKKKGIKVVNFEDLGEGAELSDVTINELYDTPTINGGNILWGSQYFFVRDEFLNAKPHRFRKCVDNILLVFGGTDPCNLSSNIYHSIYELCKKRNININIVTGPGYLGYKELELAVNNNPLVTLTKSTGVISSLMEKSQVAIVSNGRTVYELAHMNIPAIVISQHEREHTHHFSCEENGFIALGVYKGKSTEEIIVKQLRKMLDDDEYRRYLFDMTLKYRFNSQKDKVIKLIMGLIDNH